MRLICTGALIVVEMPKRQNSFFDNSANGYYILPTGERTQAGNNELLHILQKLNNIRMSFVQIDLFWFRIVVNLIS